MAGRVPPRHVPTLTEVVQPAAEPAPQAQPAEPVAREELVQRVMQRVDLALERRLRETIAATVIEQTRTLAPLLRDEIESLVREAVAQAFQDELRRG
ncbi:hypothetical protein [Ramlibacter sp.]|uniref:hypothetical protein n=1 Tax=Ramlibacter sp. TaxID=1917967 RepID=UPI002B7E4DF5|nr:hypothetical protein [Ramlibacter sp.]HWI82703.1 hypothetical protein [Ramlibacter sp.]